MGIQGRQSSTPLRHNCSHFFTYTLLEIHSPLQRLLNPGPVSARHVGLSLFRFTEIPHIILPSSLLFSRTANRTIMSASCEDALS